MADPLAAARVAVIAERGINQAVAANGGALTDAQRYWVEVGVAWGLIATLETLSQAGWITGPP